MSTLCLILILSPNFTSLDLRDIPDNFPHSQHKVVIFPRRKKKKTNQANPPTSMYRGLSQQHTDVPTSNNNNSVIVSEQREREVRDPKQCMQRRKVKWALECSADDVCGRAGLSSIRSCSYPKSIDAGVLRGRKRSQDFKEVRRKGHMSEGRRRRGHSFFYPC